MEKKIRILFEDLKQFIELCECIGVTWFFSGDESNELELTLFANSTNLFTLFYRCGLLSISIYQL
ncbi:hypothetical protein CMU25_18750 [Elizabethkingia anophelis]|nr:hypothetical protein [Elizabethkingia anophelis]MDV3842358.1 hypothetical protein [Elizabethkingia anophelis]